MGLGKPLAYVKKLVDALTRGVTKCFFTSSVAVVVDPDSWEAHETGGIAEEIWANMETAGSNETTWANLET